MSAEEFLKVSEKSALNGEQFVSHVIGKSSHAKKANKAGISAAGFITAIIILFLFFFGSGNLIPVAISNRIIEETDIQYADAVQSKLLVFQQTLQAGNIPDNAVEILKTKNILVGYIKDGGFIEDNRSGMPSVLSFNGKIITASDFIHEVNRNASLYDAINAATYSRAAYYFDDSAQKVFKNIGTSRNNYTGGSDFNKVMSAAVGEGNNISLNNVVMVEKQDENGKTYYDYEMNGESLRLRDAESMIAEVSKKNTAKTSAEATLNAADELNAADTISKKQKSELLFLTFMENISKMQAGEGNESQINEAMNYLYSSSENTVVDVKTGEVITVSGSMLESPSLYAILSGEKVNIDDTANYSSDRILKTIENLVGTTSDSINNTVVSTKSRLNGSIGRYIESSEATASYDKLSSITDTVNNSLVNNSFETIGGISGGEMLVEGAVNVGLELAKASGATAGDASAAQSYARLTSNVLALDAEADRLNRSPFDITSKNTFLGSIVYKMGIATQSNSGLRQFSSFFRTSGSAILGLLPGASADDEGERFLSNFGDCKKINSIGAVGSASCSQIGTFDTSTLNDPFNDPGFIAFVEANTTLNTNGVRTINKNSALANFIKYNVERVTPIGMMDGGILTSLNKDYISIPFLSDILSMVKAFIGSSQEEKNIASGAVFVNSDSNSKWNTYKYAQRYVSLARATENSRKYSNNDVAFNSIKFFEGHENPVVAFINEYYAEIANR